MDYETLDILFRLIVNYYPGDNKAFRQSHLPGETKVAILVLDNEQ